MAQEKSATLWVLSNRQDDRVVLFERDPGHPTGEAFVGGSTPAYVGRTSEVERLLRDGLLLEVPEPKDGPKKPLLTGPLSSSERPAMPGQVIKLGRALDPDLFPDGATKAITEQQERAGDEIAVPAGTIVPEAPTSERETKRR